jgi:hypothetical protein
MSNEDTYRALAKELNQTRLTMEPLIRDGDRLGEEIGQRLDNVEALLAKLKTKKAEPRIRAEQELQGAAKHVKYEVAMLLYAAEHLGGFHSSPMATPTGTEKNMALESFLLHVRNLRAFLYPSLQPVGNDDVVASDFLGERWARDIGDDPGVLASDKQRLNRMLAHLSYSREEFIAAGDHGWEVAQMAVAILQQMDAFLAKLSERAASWFPSRRFLSEHQAAIAWSTPEVS